MKSVDDLLGEIDRIRSQGWLQLSQADDWEHRQMALDHLAGLVGLEVDLRHKLMRGPEFKPPDKPPGEDERKKWEAAVARREMLKGKYENEERAG